MGQTYWVYLLASHGRALYCGVTRELKARVYEHRFEQGSIFTSQYQIHKLVWFESHDSPAAAIAREKQIKGWRREKKIRLIEKMNPEWDDLYAQL